MSYQYSLQLVYLMVHGMMCVKGEQPWEGIKHAEYKPKEQQTRLQLLSPH